MINIKIKIDDKYSQLTEYYKERKNYNTDLGFDIYCPEELYIDDIATIDLGISLEVSDNNNNIGYMIVPRSSFSKYDLILLNSVGIIDADYRGNIKAVVKNLRKDNKYVHIEKGTRLFQLIFPTFKHVNEFQIVNNLSKTNRNDGGFGSTGK